MKTLISIFTLVCFLVTGQMGVCPVYARDFHLPAPGTMVNLSPAYEPVIIKGLTVHKDNPFLFDFIVDIGQDKMSGGPLKKEGEKLIKYFLASLAIPDKDLWVNLSPYEKNKMVPEALGQTDMGRDLLEQDYILKQITASLIYPEKDLGKKFWDKVYTKAQEMYGTTQIPVNTFNKVWIMADRAEVYEHNQTAFVVDSHLKVMLEEDYLALSHHVIPAKGRNIPCFLVLKTGGLSRHSQLLAGIHSLGSQVVRQIILPALEKEVNTGQNFANLRQIFNSIILASWYKRNLKQALLNRFYADRSKVKGLEYKASVILKKTVILSAAKDLNKINSMAAPQNDVEAIYQQYLKAYKKGVFNYIKDTGTPNAVSGPRKYFSGGMAVGAAGNPKITNDAAQLSASLPDRALVSFETGLDLNKQAIDAAMTTRRKLLPGATAAIAGRPLGARDILITPYGQLTVKQILEGSPEWDEFQGFINLALKDPVIMSHPKYLNAIRAFQRAALDNGLFNILSGTGVSYADAIIKDHKYIHSTVGIDFELIRNLFKKGQDNQIYKLLAFDLFNKEGRTVLDQEKRQDLYVQLSELQNTVLADNELKQFIAWVVSVETMGYWLQGDYLIDNNLSPKKLENLILEEKKPEMQGFISQYADILIALMIKIPKEMPEETRELYLKIMVFHILTLSGAVPEELSERFKKDVAREFGENALLRIDNFEYFKDYNVLKPLLFLNDPPYRLPQDRAMNSSAMFGHHHRVPKPYSFAPRHHVPLRRFFHLYIDYPQGQINFGPIRGRNEFFMQPGRLTDYFFIRDNTGDRHRFVLVVNKGVFYFSNRSASPVGVEFHGVNQLVSNNSIDEKIYPDDTIRIKFGARVMELRYTNGGLFLENEFQLDTLDNISFGRIDESNKPKVLFQVIYDFAAVDGVFVRHAPNEGIIWGDG